MFENISQYLISRARIYGRRYYKSQYLKIRKKNFQIQINNSKHKSIFQDTNQYPETKSRISKHK